ncbi:hypothetical protein BDR07DRAFT_1497674 [Suillus spraguei]|nr:hypothetical protein BDR07DRAFT_1497674 [Suillus spraguei]
MSDPVGNVQHCFTPLAAYIINTPEAAMLACFGDSFRHPSHTCSITLDQLDSITVDPNDLEAYFDSCAEYQLNSNPASLAQGVFQP